MWCLFQTVVSQKHERLKRFYANSTKDKNKLDDLKVPVTILFFPNSVENIDSLNKEALMKYFPKIDWNISTRTDVKQVLRNIFVDVNKKLKKDLEQNDMKNLENKSTKYLLGFHTSIY